MNKSHRYGGFQTVDKNPIKRPKSLLMGFYFAYSAEK